VLKPVNFRSMQHLADAGLMIIEARTLKPGLRRRQMLAEAWEQQRYIQEGGSASTKCFRDAWPSFLLAGPDPCTTNPKPHTPNPKTRNLKPEIRNPKHGTRNPNPKTRNSKPET